MRNHDLFGHLTTCNVCFLRQTKLLSLLDLGEKTSCFTWAVACRGDTATLARSTASRGNAGAVESYRLSLHEFPAAPANHLFLSVVSHRTLH